MKEIVSVVKCDSYDEKIVLEKVREALKLIDFKIEKHTNVLIKPNALMGKHPDEAVTTHPSIINAVCEILKKNECNISIGESAGFMAIGGTDYALEKSGIKKVAEKFNAKIINFDTSEIVAKKIDGKVLSKINIAKPILDADFIINIPKLKTHSLVGYTGAVKNMFGIIPGGKKGDYHKTCGNQRNFSELLVDIYLARKPNLNIMDGIVGMEGNGPSAGKIKKTGIVIASKSGIALDFVAEKIIGFSGDDIQTNTALIKRNLRPEIEVKGEKNIKIRYEKPIKTFRGRLEFLMKIYYVLVNPKIKVNHKKCRKCLACMKSCPAKAITFVNGKIEINKNKCIMCYCCHEMCPEGAIDIGPSKFAKFITKIKTPIVKVLKCKQ
ncbi:MAG: DUF362 domain-containing protein [Candidatus Nanoarchaeia archaeon]|nr:DUF362 domain-containing protein [Candidatus Nanoarchaeia archaeon]